MNPRRTDRSATSADLPSTAATVPAALRPSIPVLLLLAAASTFSTDMHLAAMPAMAVDLGTSMAGLQLTLTTFLVGFALGQLVLGPLSDGLGRRTLLIAGMSTFVVATLVCAVAPNLAVLIAGRAVQGVSGAAGVVIGRAVVGDVYSGRQAARTFAILGALGGFAPVVAPLLGSAVLQIGNWRLIFAVLTAIGVLMVSGILLAVPESLPPERRQATSLTANLRRTGGLLRHREFLGYALCGSVASASLFTYTATSSFVLQTTYGVSLDRYNLIYAVNALGIVLASAAFGVLCRWYAPRTVLIGGLIVGSTGVGVLLVAAVTGLATVPLIWVCLFLQTSCMGCTMTGVLTAGIDAAGGVKGTAAALIGGIRYVLGAAVTPITGIWGTGSLVPMAAIMCVTIPAGLIALVTLTPRHRSDVASS